MSYRSRLNASMKPAHNNGIELDAQKTACLSRLTLCDEKLMKNIVDYINLNASRIVRNIDQESIDVYLFLREQFNNSNVSQNPLFQFVYRSFYRLDNAGLTPEFKTEYFSILEKNRGGNWINIETIVAALHKYPNRKRQKSLQFSFVTKMVNMIDDAKPIYDSEVARMFQFNTPPYTKTFQERLADYLKFYKKLEEVYKEIISCNKLFTVFGDLESALENVHFLSDTKKLDFLVWSAGKIKNQKNA